MPNGAVSKRTVPFFVCKIKTENRYEKQSFKNFIIEFENLSDNFFL
jgi:hypothetical protein